ncbi:hypothetical protein Y1Q_0021118 [Alligator mississippiensis]|uniref:Uncharacterized protein n=1 Tax=Alligator mississippiensis TaxID=8496 RepID=A0A151NRJ7_ALLMI|nr:hypothetical protein Y1Q_0021118 [Alligator mississippiensis]
MTKLWLVTVAGLDFSSRLDGPPHSCFRSAVDIPDWETEANRNSQNAMNREYDLFLERKCTVDLREET